MAAELDGMTGALFTQSRAILDGYSTRFCSEVFGLRPEVRIKDPSSVHGMGLRSVSLVAYDRSSKRAARSLTSVYAAGPLMRTPTKPFARGSAGRSLPVEPDDLVQLEALAAQAWIAREGNPDTAAREAATATSYRMLGEWVQSHYGVHDGGIAEYFHLGPFSVEKLSLDIVAARVGSIALNIQGSHMGRKSFINFSAPLLFADLRGLS